MKNYRILSIIIITLLVLFALCTIAKECPEIGSKSDGHTPPTATKQALNKKKNRETFPEDSQFDNDVTIRKMLNSDDDIQAFDEGKAVTITGYIYKAMSEGGESCNCYAGDAAHHDIHLLIKASKAANTKAQCVVVELTPWTKTLFPQLTTGYLNSIKNHKVKVTGWLMYDTEHKNVSAATNPDLDDAHRGTVWEIHPITEFEDLDADMDEDIEPTSGTLARYNGGGSDMNDDDDASYTTPHHAPEPPVNPKTPGQVLSIILLGALLGLTGQGIRIAVGLKKLNDISNNKEEFERGFSWKKLTVSLLYGGTIGIIGGVLMAVDSLDKVWDKSVIMAVISAGYAGADFIEGLLTKTLPATAAVKKSPTTAIVTGTPKAGGISQKDV